MAAERPESDLRVLLLAPTSRDGEATRRVLAASGIGCMICPSLDHLCGEAVAGAAAVIVPEEVVLSDESDRLAEHLRRQPVWSDLPVLVLSRSGAESPAVERAVATLGNVSLIERPTRVSTLLSVVRAALRARERQYQVRDHLDARRMVEFRFQRLVEHSPQSTQLFHPDGRTRQVNLAFEQLFGIKLVELRDYNVLRDAELVRLGVMPLMERAFAGEAVAIEPIPYVPDRGEYAGQTRWAGAYVYPVKDEGGRVEEVVLVHNDVTEQRIAEEALRHSERRLSAILDNTPAMVYVVDTENRFQFINRLWQPVFGLTNEQVVGRSIYDFFPREVADSFAENNRRVLETRAPVEAEEVAPHADGPRTYISVKVPLFDAGGNVSAVCGISADITERKRVEVRDRLLVALDDAVRSLADPAEITATCARLLGEHLGADRCAYADVEADEDTFNLTGDHNLAGVPSIVGRYRFADFGVEVLRLMREGKPYVVEDVEARQPPVGDLSYYRQTMIRAVVCVPLHKAGRFVAAMAVHQRVPRRWSSHEVVLVQAVAARCWESIERGRVLRALRQSEGRFRQLADAMPQIVWVTRPDGYHEHYNRRWYEFTGVPEGSTDGEGWNGMFHPEDRERAWATWRHSLATGEAYEIEYRLRHHSGEYRWTLGRALPVRDEHGRIERWFGTCTDIDALKRLTDERESLLGSERAAREEAERAGRMKDEFLATLSHELRTPLNAILGWSQILASGSRDEGDLAEGLRTIERNARAQTQIIEDLLDMSRIISGKIRLDVQRLDLAGVVQAAVDTMRPAADAKAIRLQAVLDPKVATVSGDPGRLHQVFWNLISNAIKFTPKGGPQVSARPSSGPFHPTPRGPSASTAGSPSRAVRRT